jgi:hypothetical protein
MESKQNVYTYRNKTNTAQLLQGGLKRKIMKRTYFALLFVLMLTGIANTALGQPPSPPPPAAVPIDGGLALLFAAGIGIGVKKVWNARKSD